MAGKIGIGGSNFGIQKITASNLVQKIVHKEASFNFQEFIYHTVAYVRKKDATAYHMYSTPHNRYQRTFTSLSFDIELFVYLGHIGCKHALKYSSKTALGVSQKRSLHAM